MKGYLRNGYLLIYKVSRHIRDGRKKQTMKRIAKIPAASSLGSGLFRLWSNFQHLNVNGGAL